MKRKASFLLAVFLMTSVCSPVFGLTLDDYEPYREIEFPRWSLDLRRAECIFFGGIPIAFPVAGLAMGLAGMRDATFLQTLGVACSITAAIALVDYIIGVVCEN